MPAKYAHTNIIAKDWKGLAEFYTEVFDCQFVPPERNQSGDWLSQATGIENASLQGVHLRLPGFGDDGPTLEIYSYDQMLEKASPAANRMGLGHLAFAVDDVEACLAQVIQKGGSSL